MQLNVDAHKPTKDGGETNGSSNNESQMQVTIGEILEENFPRLFERALSDEGELEVAKKRDFDIVVQGIEVDMKTPLYWMQ